MGIIIGRPGVSLGGLQVGRPQIALAGGGVRYEFAAGTLAGEVERLTASGDYTLNVNGNNLPVEYVQYDTDLTVAENTDFGDDTPDERMVCVKVKGNLTIDEDVTVTTQVRKLGLLFFVTGDVTVDGTIDMTARGANHSESGSDLEPFDLLVVGGIGADGIVPAQGGAGAAGAAGNVVGVVGTAGANGGTGGGGSGACSGGANATQDGAAGTLWSGGPGSGGAAQGVGAAPVGRGGIGGVGRSSQGGRVSGGGAGNPGSNGGENGEGNHVSSKGDDGTGGLIVAIVLGAITVAATGIVRANGSNGGNAVSADIALGGGGSGGGSVNLYRRGSYTNSGTVQANGGAGGTATGGTTANRVGGAGGAGSVRSVAI